MLKPAILYKEEIVKKFQERLYTDDMLYETGCSGNWCPEIAECPDGSTFQFAIVDKTDKCIGFVGFEIDWYALQAYNFGLISFDKGNIVVGKALQEIMDMIINQYKIYRIEWRMVGGNPVERSYDRFCKKYNGTKHVFHDAIRDQYGNYRDSVVYEILIKENKNAR
jgi:RimJ/RimL family protein N-acetyltransferase